MKAPLPWRILVPLSIAQIVSWGTLIYAFTLFVGPMQAELGWSAAELAAGYSLGLLASAVGAVPVGRLIDQGQGRWVMAGGSLLASALLALWSQVESYGAFLLVWAGLGLSMSATLYDPAFAILTRSLGSLSRRAITAMSLWGGFASTVMLPLSQAMIGGWGWRGALLGLAVLNVACAVTHGLFVPGGSGHGSEPGPQSTRFRRVLREPAFWGLVVVALLHSTLLSATLAHLVPLLVDRGFSLAGAIAAFALFGPAQVAMRLVLSVLGERASLRAVGIFTTGAMAAAFILLPFIPAGSLLLFAFTVLFGAANGLMTILRAVLPQEFFGRADFGTIQGMIVTPASIARAGGPLGLALLWTSTGSSTVVLAACAATALACAVIFIVAVRPPRPPRDAP